MKDCAICLRPETCTCLCATCDAARLERLEQADIANLRGLAKAAQHSHASLVQTSVSQLATMVEASKQFTMGAITVNELQRHVLNYAFTLSEIAITEARMYELEGELRKLTNGRRS